MADNTRNKGRATSLGVATAAATVSRAGLPAPPPTPPGRPQPNLPAVHIECNITLARILERLDDLDEMKGAMQRIDQRGELHKKDFDEGMSRITRELEESRTARRVMGRDLLIARQELVSAREDNRRMGVQINSLMNQMKICNLRIDGKAEDSTENLKRFILDMAADMRAQGLVVSDITAAYRVGKPIQPGARTRPRTILVTFVSERTRNLFFFARTKLKAQDRYKYIYVNDDVSPATRRQRDDYRAVAAVARTDGADVRVHTDGIILNGQKYLLTEPHSLPERYTVEKAKTLEVGGEIYFASGASYLSNFFPTPIIEGDDVYASAEHMYQARKCKHAKALDKMRMVMAAPTPLDAKYIADSITITPEWRNIRDGVMKEVVSAKFSQNKLLASKLLATGDTMLNEATHNDHFGIGVTLMAKEIKDKSYRGSNKLGLILMAERESMRATTVKTVAD